MKFVIPGELTDLNKWYNTAKSRMGHHTANRIKKQNMEIVAWSCKGKKLEPSDNGYAFSFAFYVPNQKKDPDNLVFAKKFILDGLVASGVLENDGWKQVKSFQDTWAVDKENPRVEVTIEPFI